MVVINSEITLPIAPLLVKVKKKLYIHYPSKADKQRPRDVNDGKRVVCGVRVQIQYLLIEIEVVASVFLQQHDSTLPVLQPTGAAAGDEKKQQRQKEVGEGDQHRRRFECGVEKHEQRQKKRVALLVAFQFGHPLRASAL